MESYSIHVEHSENIKMAFVVFNDLGEVPQSVRECKFQTIGWILCVFDKMRALVDEWDEIIHESNVSDALINLASLDWKTACALVRAETWRERFNLIWPLLGYQDQALALGYDYDDEENKNYWPGFDSFNMMFRDFVKKLPLRNRRRASTEHVGE
ncbi:MULTISPECIES: hypothetical protein [unclassified Pseudomonas]|jgi:hypothetical protein|uniref:hypothetical protein n=1 Tax=unclassified Pseudomonas TaxID=196821 RepID=UPI000D6CEDF4|nr:MULTISPECIES: hypothetical protein [unclassified Pseudomonas]PWK45891.1 hypothetical protein C7534_101492 [Pseudomonas sp. OV226]WNZ81625.1 hypothetical protein QOM10_15050 [Pseudomonas sp. P108]